MLGNEYGENFAFFTSAAQHHHTLAGTHFKNQNAQFLNGVITF